MQRTYFHAGFLFRAQPSLMTLDSSATIMDGIFSSTDEESRGRLLRIMQEFLVSEAAKHTAKEKGTDFRLMFRGLVLKSSYRESQK